MYEEINPEFVEQIKNKVSVEDYASQYVQLNYEKGGLVGLCPFHDEKTPSFKISSDRRFFHCFGCDASGDVLDFAQRYHGVSYPNAVRMVAHFGGLKNNSKPISDTIKVFRKFKPIARGEVYSHQVLDYAEYEQFKRRHIPQWENEGITPETLKTYDIRFDYNSNRIVYPVYDIYGNLINIKGRTIHENWKELGIPKYINYHKVGTMDYLQGLNISKDYVKAQHELIIFEGFKSCMKAHQFGFDNQASAETSSLKYEQIKTILSLNCDVVIAFDKDKMIKDYIKGDLLLLAKLTNVYVIEDFRDLLGDPANKLSPVDAGEKVWRELYQNRRRVIV